MYLNLYDCNNRKIANMALSNISKVSEYRNFSIINKNSSKYIHKYNAAYIYYCIMNGIENAIPFDTYKDIIRLYYNLLEDDLINGDVCNLRYGLGNLLIRKKKTTANMMKCIFRRYKNIETPSSDSNGYSITHSWIRKGVHLKDYIFRASSKSNKRLCENIKNGYYNNYQNII